jgi:Na+/H+ antiporter NhaD/arsenite permease-like protein
LDASATATQTEQPHPHQTRLSGTQIVAAILGTIALALLIYHSMAHDAVSAHHPKDTAPGLWSAIPFAGLLLCIAILPLLPATTHWWESNQNRLMVSMSFAAVTLLYFLLTSGAEKVVLILEHAVIAEYLPFIILLFSLYVISGGIALHGDLAAHPLTNTGFLAFGATIASLIGTTGASMLLIRPLLQTNRERKYVTHTVIFFIFLVSNIGGCLLPIGDPPLFLGYLKGVPFLWTLNLWTQWMTMSAILLLAYFIWDSILYRRESAKDIARDETATTKLSLCGRRNFFFLAGVVLIVALVKPGEELPLIGIHPFPFMREVLMLVLVALSLKLTPRGVRESNRFDYHAILEVAALFIGIFICMQAPIEILRHSGHALEPILRSPMHFFWATGALSSFLDNAPTYVVFFETAASMTPDHVNGALRLPDGTTIHQTYLVAISLGSVFMGAMSYIGNGPNFMVKSIAQQSGVRMPSFFGYMIYSTMILVPLFIVITLIFL